MIETFGRAGIAERPVSADAHAGTPADMSTTRTTGTALGSSNASTFAEGLIAHVHEPEPVSAEDVWPLEVWMSREESLFEADTWHTGKGRGLRSLVAGIILGR